VKKLIETGYEDGPKDPNRPCAKGISWHLHVVRVGNGGPHFGVGRLILPFCKTRWDICVVRWGVRYAPAVVSELESMLGSKKMPFLSMPFWNWKAVIASFEREWETDVGRVSAAKLTA